MLNALAPYIPVTVAGAFLIFAIKEAIELARRRRADRRKIAAIKRFIARDLELCAWAISGYRSILRTFEDVDDMPSHLMRTFAEPSGRLRFEHWDDGDESPFRSGSMIAPVVNTFASKFMLDIATLDEELYHQVEAATDSLAELEHIKASIIEQTSRPMHRVPFVNYARKELSEIEAAITELYKICTGHHEIRARLR